MLRITLKLQRIENYWGTTCGKDRQSVAAIIGPRRPYMATKIAVDGLGTNCDMTVHLN